MLVPGDQQLMEGAFEPAAGRGVGEWWWLVHTFNL